MAESEEALQLKRRARRRLVGAIALVTFVVIILPLILDKEPGPAGPPLDVQIPKQESGGFTSRAAPPALQMPAAPVVEKKAEGPAAKAEPVPPKLESPPIKAAALPASTGPSPIKAESSRAKVEPLPAGAEPAVANKAASAPAPAAVKAGQERAQTALADPAWVVSLDAFSNAANVKQLRTKLSAAGIKSYTEPVKTSKGELTRVRAGPFASKEAAEKARTKLVAMGLKPGAAVSR
jgi:DedD protein